MRYVVSLGCRLVSLPSSSSPFIHLEVHERANRLREAKEALAGAVR